MSSLDHPILLESFNIILNRITPTGLGSCQEDVLVRLIHASGDFRLSDHLRFSPAACASALESLANRVSIITDTRMATAAITPMVERTFRNQVICILDYLPKDSNNFNTKSAAGMTLALSQYPNSLVLVGSSPTALDAATDFYSQSTHTSPLVIGMPVGFVGVTSSKRKLAQATSIPQIRIEGSRGGAGLASATLNALLRRAWLDQQANG